MQLLITRFLQFLAVTSLLTIALASQEPLLSISATHGIDALLSLHRHLVRIESITGAEREVSDYLASYLRGLNYSVERQSVWGDRYNVFAYAGKKRNNRVLVTSHIDTVPPFYDYELRERGTQIYGRGSADAKGCVAAQINAVERLRADRALSAGDVALLFVVGEETIGDGMRAANRLGLAWEAVIFGEPTALHLATGHKGIFAFNVHAHGKSAHSGYPELGLNANSLLIRGLAALEKLSLPSSDKFGNTTLNVGRIAGGVAANVIPAEAEASIAVRLAAGTVEEAKALVVEAVHAVDRRLEVHFTFEGYGPVDIDSDVDGFPKMTVNYGTDIPHLHGTHRRYLYGPGSILVAHSDHEHVSVRDLEEAVGGYERLIKDALGRER
ncbi:MAG: hypothetical protein M1832_003241 [Thelocarpon impressellum]|nr:MAG: hypothetical protein M1832_003241 [Thelocarpon impressellum]